MLVASVCPQSLPFFAVKFGLDISEAANKLCGFLKSLGERVIKPIVKRCLSAPSYISFSLFCLHVNHGGLYPHQNISFDFKFHLRRLKTTLKKPEMLLAEPLKEQNVHLNLSWISDIWSPRRKVMIPSRVQIED